MLFSDTKGSVPVKEVIIPQTIIAKTNIETGCRSKFLPISPLRVLNAARTSITASISSVGRKRSAEVSGMINLSCTESGTRNTVRIKNLSIDKNANKRSKSAGGASHNKPIPEPAFIKASIGKTRERISAGIIRPVFILLLDHGFLPVIP
jgi:hypothetical protein